MLSDQDKALLQELDLQDMPAEAQAIQLSQYYDTLKLRVGMALEDHMDDAQLEAFAKVSDETNDEKTTDWLRQHIAGYQQIIDEETAKLKQEIKQTSAEFI